MKSLDAKAHWEPSRSEAVHGYCHKEETCVPNTRFSYGQLPVRMNKREDWEKIWQHAANDQFMEIPANIRFKHFSQCQKIRAEYAEPKSRDLKVIFIWGPPRIGKTTWALKQWPEAYLKLNRNKWWDGYRGHKVVILDDFSGSIHFDHLKRWMDPHPCLLEIKGGTIPAKYETLCITSNTDVHEWWPGVNQVHIQAIEDRITKTYHLTDRILNLDFFDL